MSQYTDRQAAATAEKTRLEGVLVETGNLLVQMQQSREDATGEKKELEAENMVIKKDIEDLELAIQKLEQEKTNRDHTIRHLNDEIAKNYSEEVKTLMKAEMKEQMKLVHKSELLGQMPHVVAKDRKSEEFDDSDIEIIEEIVPVGKANAAKAMKSELVMFAKDSPSYANNGSQSSDHGKTDIQAVEKSNTSSNPGDTWMCNAIVADSSWGMMVTEEESDA